MCESALHTTGEGEQLSHRVAAYVRERIIIEQPPAGQFLRTEMLATELGVSATPVREALMSLQSEGTVRWEPRRGFRVISFRDEDVRDLFRVQAYIAGELAARAALVLNTEAVGRLRQLQDQLAAAAERGVPATVEDINHEIHRRINKASGSPRLSSLLDQTVRYIPLTLLDTVEGWAHASVHDHSPVIDALGAGEAEAARAAMACHIDHIGELLIAHRQSARITPAP